MRVIGIDPGLERIGFGVVEKNGSKLTCIEHGLIQTPRISLPDRLLVAYDELIKLIQKISPDRVATERLVFAANTTTALDVSKALGVILLCTGQIGIPWNEYAASQVKQAVVGNGRAEKKQVEFMVTRIINLEKPPRSDDVADALAIAICDLMQPSVLLAR